MINKILSSQAEKHLGFGKLQSQGSSLSVHTTLIGRNQDSDLLPSKGTFTICLGRPCLGFLTKGVEKFVTAKVSIAHFSKVWKGNEHWNQNVVHSCWTVLYIFSEAEELIFRFLKNSFCKQGRPSHWPSSNNSGSVLDSHNGKNKSKADAILLQCLFWAVKIQAELLQIITCINTVLLASAPVYLS